MADLNIIYIIPHDLGQELHCYGRRSILSPNLDRLAAEGVLFENYFCASPPCSPSRGCIMTGRYAHSNGLIGLVNRGWALPDNEPTIVNYLGEAGYSTHLFGGQHERADVHKYGYDELWLESARADKVCDAVIDFLQSRDPDAGPFYLNAMFFEVHLPFDKPQYTFADPAAVDVPGYLPDNPDVRLELARFHGAVRFMDEHVGRLLRALDASPLRENTLVVFTTDHGAAFPRAKSTLYDPGIGTALIMRLPPSLQAAQGRRVRELLSNVDLTPTLLELAGVPVPARVQGRSFAPLLTGGAYEPRAAVFCEKNFHDSYDPMRCVRTERYKYIRNFSDQPVIPLPTDIAKSIASRHLGPESDLPHPPEELYDLANDPWELTNLAQEPAARPLKEELCALLDGWMKATADPVENGMPPLPAQQPVNDPDRHPKEKS